MHRYTRRTLVLEIVLFIVAVVYLVPVYVLLVNSFKHQNDPSDNFGLPAVPTLDNYAIAWTQGGLGPAFITSAIITVSSIVILVGVCSLASYALARVSSRWSKLAYYFFMFGLMLPFQLALIPLYVTLRESGLVGNPIGLVVVYAGTHIPMCIFLYTEFLRSIPADYDEAAFIDGASRLQTYWHVIMPMCRPITGTVVILQTVSIWNDFFAPLLMLSGSGTKTLPLAIYSFISDDGSQWNIIFAALILGSLPVLIAFFIMQKAVFRGFASGLKG